MKYYVKTRNWHCNRTIFNLISKVPCARGDSYTDGDGKFYYQSNSLVKAFAVLLYWKILSYWSGGWTYICNEHKYPNGLPTSKGTLFI